MTHSQIPYKPNNVRRIEDVINAPSDRDMAIRDAKARETQDAIEAVRVHAGVTFGKRDQ